MKKLLFILFSICVSNQTHAQPSQFSQQDINAMMDAMKKMQACMQNIDKNEIKRLEQQTKVFEQEIQALCRKGKRSQAQSKAKDVFEEMLKNPISIKLKKCSTIMEGVSSGIEIDDIHVCDAAKN